MVESSDLSVIAGRDVIWTPQAGPQTAFIRCPFKEVLYGGAAGGGKSDALLGDFASGIEQYGGAWRGILIRREYKQLEELESRALEIFSPHYGLASYKKGSNTWYFNTAKGVAQLRLRAIADDRDVLKHQGHQFSWIGIDEAGHFPSDYVLEYLLTRLRSPKGAPTYVRLTANPGGIGHSWLKERFRIGVHPAMGPFDLPATASGDVSQRIFIPAKLTDNRILMENDPTYADRLDAIADPILRRALRDGDWDIVSGAAFPEFRKDVHVVDNHVVPDGAVIWRSMDWGYNKPFACLWGYADFDGSVNVCGEYYGCGIKPDTGVRMDPEQVAERVRRVEEVNGWSVREAYLDPQCWAQHGGATIFEQLGGHKMRWKPWSKEHNWRRNKKQLLHSYLRVINGESRLTIQKRCTHLIRTLGILPLDERNPEDVDSRSEDHLYDALCGLLSKNVPTKEQIIRRNLDEWEWARRETSGTQRKYGGW